MATPQPRVVVLALLVAAAGIPGTATPTAEPPTIRGVVANPVAPDDHGEYLVLHLPAGTTPSDVTLTDGETTVGLPDRAVTGRVLVSTRPGAVVAASDDVVLPLDGRLALANDGETIHLMVRGRVVDTVTYDRAPEAEILERTPAGWRWRPLGFTDRPVVAAEEVAVTAFVLPDDPVTPIATLDAAEERLLLAAYTLRSRRVVEALCAAADRGVAVRVLVEASPVGGRSERGAAALDDLVACEVPVDVVGVEHARYAFHHAKYAVVDDRAIVLTENWVPGGTGGRSSRGWGVVVESPRVADDLAATFSADASWRDVAPWPSYRADRSFTEGPAPSGETYPARFAPASHPADRVSVIVAPDNAEAAVIGRIDGATESVRVQQLSIGDRNTPFLRAAVRAAERGVRVRILLSGASYVRGHNGALAEALNERARREGLPLEARVSTPRSRYGKVHTKGVVIDDDVAIVGSLNWNNNSARANREVALVVEGDPAAYYGRVFDADWQGGRWGLPVGLATAVVAAGLTSAIAGGRLARFR